MTALPTLIPPVTEPFGTLAPNGKDVMISRNWYLLHYNVTSKALAVNSAPTPAAQAVTPTGSPFTFTAPVTGNLAVSGGQNLSMSLARGSVSAPVSAGLIPMSGSDTLTVSYIVAPSMVFFPFANTSTQT